MFYIKGGPEEKRDWFETKEDEVIYERYNSSDAFQPLSNNLWAVTEGKRVILANRMYVAQLHQSDHLYGFPRNVFASPLQIIMKRGFPLRNEFNWIIRWMRNAGLFNKILQDFKFNYTVLVKIQRMRPEILSELSDTDGVQNFFFIKPFLDTNIVLTTHHLEGPFAILFLGLAISFVAYTAEWIFFFYLEPILKRHRLKVQPKKHASKRNNKKNANILQNERKFVKVNRDGYRFTPISRRKVF